MSEYGRCVTHHICDCKHEELERLRQRVEDCKTWGVWMKRREREKDQEIEHLKISRGGYEQMCAKMTRSIDECAHALREAQAENEWLRSIARHVRYVDWENAKLEYEAGLEDREGEG